MEKRTISVWGQILCCAANCSSNTMCQTTAALVLVYAMHAHRLPIAWYLQQAYGMTPSANSATTIAPMATSTALFLLRHGFQEMRQRLEFHAKRNVIVDLTAKLFIIHRYGRTTRAPACNTCANYLRAACPVVARTRNTSLLLSSLQLVITHLPVRLGWNICVNVYSQPLGFTSFTEFQPRANRKEDVW